MRQRFRIRMVSFVGTEEFTQGMGMTYDSLDVVVDLDDGEEIFLVERTWKRGRGFDAQIPAIRVWIKTPVALDEAISSE